MSNRLTRWLQSDEFFPKQGIDDVLVLSTGENLEQHADTAAEEADRRLSGAVAHETKTEEALVQAEANHELAVERRFNKEKLVKSITSIIRRLR